MLDCVNYATYQHIGYLFMCTSANYSTYQYIGYLYMCTSVHYSTYDHVSRVPIHAYYSENYATYQHIGSQFMCTGSYPEWQHRQGGCLACCRLQVCKIESRLWLSCTDLYYARGAQGVLPMRVGGRATCQLELPSLTPLSVAGCGRLQLGVPHWDTSVDYCK